MEIYRFTVNRLEENTMIASGRDGACVLVDPGWYYPDERDKVLDCLKEKGLRPEAVLLTHGHMDHIYGVAEAQRLFDIPVYMSEADVSTMEYYDRVSKFGIKAADHSFSISPVSDGQIIEAAGLRFKVISTPGHSPGCVCFLEEEEGVLFTGDTLFAGAIGRSDLIGGDYDAEIRSIMEKLMPLDGDIAIYPGHGGPSTIGTERVTNPFLEPFNEREEIPELNDYV